MNGRLGKAKFNWLSIIIYSGAISSIIPGKYTQKLQDKITKPVYWSTKVDYFNTSYNIQVDIVLYELDATKSLMWNFRVGDSQGNHRCDMILRRDKLSKLK